MLVKIQMLHPGDRGTIYIFLKKQTFHFFTKDFFLISLDVISNPMDKNVLIESIKYFIKITVIHSCFMV